MTSHITSVGMSAHAGATQNDAADDMRYCTKDVPDTSREIISMSDIDKTMDQSLQILMEWEKADIPSRFAFGSGELRKLMTRVREQPVNFLIVTHQSVVTARHGQSQCRVGKKAVMILLGEESELHSSAAKKQFTTTTLEEIKAYASDLDQSAKDILDKFRLLRIALLEVHDDLKNFSDKRERSAFLTPLSRLNKDVRKAESALGKVLEKIEGIENSLNLVIQWWQTIEAHVDYLRMLEDSPLISDRNEIMLREIKKGFTALGEYFAEYRDKMRLLYDENVIKLNENHRTYLKQKECTSFIISKQGAIGSPNHDQN